MNSYAEVFSSLINHTEEIVEIVSIGVVAMHYGTSCLLFVFLLFVLWHHIPSCHDTNLLIGQFTNYKLAHLQIKSSGPVMLHLIPQYWTMLNYINIR